MTKYRKKPVVVEARNIETYDQHFLEWAGANVRYIDPEDREDDAEFEVWDKLHSTWIAVYPGQWIIEGVKGEFYPCDAQVFADTYEAVIE